MRTTPSPSRLTALRPACRPARNPAPAAVIGHGTTPRQMNTATDAVEMTRLNRAERGGGGRRGGVQRHQRQDQEDAIAGAENPEYTASTSTSTKTGEPLHGAGRDVDRSGGVRPRRCRRWRQPAGITAPRCAQPHRVDDGQELRAQHGTEQAYMGQPSAPARRSPAASSHGPASPSKAAHSATFTAMTLSSAAMPASISNGTPSVTCLPPSPPPRRRALPARTSTTWPASTCPPSSPFIVPWQYGVAWQYNPIIVLSTSDSAAGDMNMYERLTAEPAAAIRGGELAGGSAPPPVRDFARLRGIGPSTAARVHASPRQQGLVIGGGRGTFRARAADGCRPRCRRRQVRVIGRSAVALEAQEPRAAPKAAPPQPDLAAPIGQASPLGRTSIQRALAAHFAGMGWMSRRSGSAPRMADRPHCRRRWRSRSAGSGWRPTPSPIPAGSSPPASLAWTWNRRFDGDGPCRTSWSGYRAAGGSRRCTACPWRICPWAGSCRRSAAAPSPSWPASMISR